MKREKFFVQHIWGNFVKHKQTFWLNQDELISATWSFSILNCLWKLGNTSVYFIAQLKYITSKENEIGMKMYRKILKHKLLGKRCSMFNQKVMKNEYLFKDWQCSELTTYCIVLERENGIISIFIGSIVFHEIMWSF